MLDLAPRHRRNDGVVHEIRRQPVALIVVADLFHERLCDTMGDAPVHLTFRKQWVQNRARIVYGDQPHELHRTR